MINRRARNNRGIAPLLIFGIAALVAVTIIAVTARGCEQQPPPQPVSVNVTVTMPGSTGNTTLTTSVMVDPKNPGNTNVTIRPNNGNIGGIPDGDVHANANDNPGGPTNTNGNSNTPVTTNGNGPTPDGNSNVPGQPNTNQQGPVILFKQAQPASPQSR